MKKYLHVNCIIIGEIYNSESKQCENKEKENNPEKNGSRK